MWAGDGDGESAKYWMAAANGRSSAARAGPRLPQPHQLHRSSTARGADSDPNDTLVFVKSRKTGTRFRGVTRQTYSGKSTCPEQAQLSRTERLRLLLVRNSGRRIRQSIVLDEASTEYVFHGRE